MDQTPPIFANERMGLIQHCWFFRPRPFFIPFPGVSCSDARCCSVTRPTARFAYPVVIAYAAIQDKSRHVAATNIRLHSALGPYVMRS